VRTVPQGSRDFFLSAAKTLAEGEDPINLLAAALARISNLAEIGNRALLSSQVGYKTLLLKFSDPIRSAGIM
jgi:hypothetical protein